MVDTIIDIVFTDYDLRHNFTNNKHPRKPDGHFLATPANTHYEALHKNKKNTNKGGKLAFIRKRLHAVKSRRQARTGGEESGSDNDK